MWHSNATLMTVCMENLTMTDKIVSYIGLAQRANGVLYGEDIIVEKLRLAKVVLIDSAASNKYKERMEYKCGNCPCFVLDNLGQALHRNNVKAVAVTNDGLAKAIIDLLR